MSPNLGHMKPPYPQITSIEESLIGLGARRPDEQALPRLVIRGESTINPPSTDESSFPKISKIDYLSFSYKYSGEFDHKSPLVKALLNVFNIPPEDWQRTNAGWNGYEKRIDLGRFGMVAFGGESQNNTVHVQINGQGCSQITNWKKVCEWGERSKCKITRLDIAHDDFEGEIVNIKNGLKWREDGLFDSNGRPPNSRLIDDFDSGAGKTLYIGSRKNGKLLRIYEKGKQLKDPLSPWCRVEVEFRSKSRKIDWDVITNSDSYLAGSYPALSFLAKEQSVIATTKHQNTILIAAAKKWMKSAVGQYLNFFCQLADEDIESVVKDIRRAGIPKKLQPCYEAFLNGSEGKQ